MCPSRVRRVSPVARSHSRSVLSSEPERARLPSASTATALTATGVPFEGAQGLAGRQIPQPQRVVIGAGEGAAAVGQHRHRVDRIGVPFEGAQGLAGREIPQPQRVVIGAGEGAAAVGQHRHRADRSGVPFEGAQGLAGRQIPQPQRVVIGAGEGAAAVGQHRHRVDRSGVPFEGAQGLAGRQIPQPQRVVIGAGEGAAAVGQHRHRVTQAVCPSKVRRVSPVARSHSRSVLSEEPERARLPSASTATALTEAGVPFEGAQGLAGREIPQPQRVVIGAGEGAAAVGEKRHRADTDPCVRPGSGAAVRRAASARQIADAAKSGQDPAPLPRARSRSPAARVPAAARAIDRAIATRRGTAPGSTDAELAGSD